MKLQVQVFDQHDSFLYSVPGVCLDMEVDLFSRNLKFERLLSSPFEIPGATDGEPSAFFPAGLFMFSEINNEIWFMQDSRKLFKPEISEEGNIKMKLSSSSKQYYNLPVAVLIHLF